MLLDTSVEKIIEILGNDRETTLKEMKYILQTYGISFSNQRQEAFSREDLPEICILSLETPRCWHWSLYADGTFYDPEHGVSDDFPECKRKYYWTVYKN